ncbi:chitin recognition protein [Colletotrichum sp. SAR11_240]|nr:chitin recognition protein [Colletotrichum sp. SAR11_240]
MRWSPLLLASLTGLEFAQAHGHDEHEPHMNVIWGRGGPSELRQKRAAYEAWNPPSVPLKPRGDATSPLEARQTSGQTQALPSGIAVGDGSQCGPTYGACNPGDCCSASGWCGQGPDYCNSPDCQISYGPACDGNQRPSGLDTSNDARPKLGSVPYGGVGIYNCVNDGDVAITYDDGPYLYTDGMLDAFKAHGAVATWFITGNNIGKGMINANYVSTIQRMIAEGHQVASHTWSHENLDSLTLSQRKNQMVYNEIAFTDILGFYPTYMRPPYSICGSECQGQMADLGYHITYFDLDTQGYLHTDPSQIGVSVNLWDQAMQAKSPCNGSYLHIEHDIHQQIAQVLTPHILDSVVANGWRAVTVGECLGDPVENWYRRGNPGYNFNITASSPAVCASTASKTTTAAFSTGGATTLPTSTTGTAALPSSTLPVSDNGECGSNNGRTCIGYTQGSCCSQYNYCGSTDAHCGTGCQSVFGTCGSSVNATSPSGTASAAAGSSSRASSAGTASASAPLASSTFPATSDGTCGAAAGKSCVGYSGGTCCSQYNYCGNTDAHCGTGCQSLFGSCQSSASGGSSAASSAAGQATGTRTASASASTNTNPSSDGSCGGTKGFNCLGTNYGDCCSPYGYCGNTTAHCDTGCQSGFGKCSGTGSDVNVSLDGKCGTTGTSGSETCQGSTFGNCCSAYGYCGSTDLHCGTGCQSSFGTCGSSSAATSSAR